MFIFVLKVVIIEFELHAKSCKTGEVENKALNHAICLYAVVVKNSKKALKLCFHFKLEKLEKKIR